MGGAGVILSSVTVDGEDGEVVFAGVAGVSKSAAMEVNLYFFGFSGDEVAGVETTGVVVVVVVGLVVGRAGALVGALTEAVTGADVATGVSSSQSTS